MSRTIYRHCVEITDGKGIIKSAEGFSIQTVDVVAESDKQIVVLDPRFGHFVVVEKTLKDNIYTRLGAPSISFTVNDSLFGSSVSYMLYSESKKRPSAIRKEIEKEIFRKFGFFISGIDLDCITGTKNGGAA